MTARLVAGIVALVAAAGCYQIEAAENSVFLRLNRLTGETCFYSAGIRDQREWDEIRMAGAGIRPCEDPIDPPG